MELLPQPNIHDFAVFDGEIRMRPVEYLRALEAWERVCKALIDKIHMQKEQPEL